MASGIDERSSMSSVGEAVAAIASGRLVVVVDDEGRENEGDLIGAAELVGEESVAFMIRHTSGVLCVAMEREDLDRLDLPPMVAANEDPNQTAFTITTDAVAGTTTGISAADRARTIATLADKHSQATDLRRPGHVFPLQARAGGVLKRVGHTEAAVDLARMAGLRPAGVLAELVNDDGSMPGLAQLQQFAREHRLPIISVAALVRYRMESERLVERAATVPIATAYGLFTAHAYRSLVDGEEHLALTCGDIASPEPVLVRVHSECLTGDLFGSHRCDCGDQLSSALQTVCNVGRGIILYLRGQEGRGIGLAHKLRAYALQDGGLDTVDANVSQGLPIDDRDYGIGAQILKDLGVHSIRVMTNNPAKYEGLAAYGLSIVERVPVVTAVHDGNRQYLLTKKHRLGHLLDIPTTPEDSLKGLRGRNQPLMGLE